MNKKYEASYVYAFTSSEGKDKAHGNPALIVFGDPVEKDKQIISKESKILLNDEMMKLPIICFIEPIENKECEFNIKYRFCNGMPVNVCGHGSMAAAKAVVDKYNITKSCKLIFHLDQNFEENRQFPILGIRTDGKIFTIEFDDVKIWNISDNHPVSQLFYKHFKSIIPGSVYETKLNDYIFVCANADDVRNVNLFEKGVKKVREFKSNYRGIMVVAPSNKQGYDYETTVFSDGLPGPLYKDPACGSANKEIPQLLKVNNIFPERFKTDIEHFKMFYPFRYSELGIMGGIQTVEYKHKEGIIFVSGSAEIGDRVWLEVDKNSLYFNKR